MDLGIVDSHCHLDDPSLAGSLDEALRLALTCGVRGALIPAYGPCRWPRQTELMLAATAFRLWGAFGLHPWAALGVASDHRALLEAGYARFACRWGERLKAIGEFGLDRSPRGLQVPLNEQRELFKLHLEWAQRLDLPVVLHLVKADGPAFELLEEAAPMRGVIHGFSSHPETVARYAALGLSFSYGAALMSSEKARRALQATPSDRLLFETDAPQALCRSFAAPWGPHHLIEIVQTASQVLGKSVEYCLARHQENCDALFRLS